MKTFYCPYCDQKLTVLDGSAIHFVGLIKTREFECSATFLLPSALGIYDTFTDSSIKVKEGTKVDFRCPKCNDSFTSSYDDDLAEIKMIDDDEHEYVAIFNRIYGKHSTFLADYQKKNIKNSFGEDKDDYIHGFDKPVNFFGE